MADYVITAPRWRKTTVNIEEEQWRWCRKNFINVTRLLRGAIENLKEDSESGETRSGREENMQIMALRHQFLMDKFMQNYGTEQMQVLLVEMAEHVEKAIKKTS